MDETAVSSSEEPSKEGAMQVVVTSASNAIPFRKSKSVCDQPHSQDDSFTDPKSCRSISGYIENGQFSVCTTTRNSQDSSSSNQTCSIMNDVSSLNNVLLANADDNSASVGSAALSSLTVVSNDNQQNNWIFIGVDKPEKVLAPLDTFVTYRIVSKYNSPNLMQPEHQVRRRYSDFVWLRHRLEAKYPLSILPALPEKHSVYSLDRFDPEFIKYRCMGLNLFMQWLIKCSRLSCDPDLVNFVSLNDFDEWFSYRKTKLTPSSTCPEILPAGITISNGSPSSPVSSSVPFLFSSKCVSSSNTSSGKNSLAKNGIGKSKNEMDEFESRNEYCSKLAQILLSLNKMSLKLNKAENDCVKEMESFHTVFNYWSEFESSFDPNSFLRPCVDSAAEALKQNFDELSLVVKNFEPNFIIPAHLFALYTEAVRQMLKKRDHIVNEYKLAEENLQKKQNEHAILLKNSTKSISVPSSGGPVSGSVATAERNGTTLNGVSASVHPKRDSDSTKLTKIEQQLLEAKRRSEIWSSSLKNADTQLKCELDRWLAFRDEELRLFIGKIAQQRVTMHQKCAEAWKNALDAANV